MRLQTRLRRLERRGSAAPAGGDTDVFEIWVPYDGRGGNPLGRHPCEGAGPW